MLPSDVYWHVLYTMPRYEKKVHHHLLKSGIESFLPLHSVTRLWSDRKKKMQVPLFPNYLFVKLLGSERHRVFSVNGVLKYVTVEGKPCKIPEEVIDNIRIIVKANPHIVNADDYFNKGEILRVCAGPLKGLKGELVETKGKSKLIIRIEAVQRLVIVEVLKAHLVRDNSKVLFV